MNKNRLKNVNVYGKRDINNNIVYRRLDSGAVCDPKQFPHSLMAVNPNDPNTDYMGFISVPKIESNTIFEGDLNHG